MKRFGTYLFAGLSLLVLHTSCLTTRQTNLLQETGGGIPAYPSTESIGEYTIKPGDELNVRIMIPGDNPKNRALFGFFSSGNINHEMSDGNSKLRTFAVSPEGYIYFPYIDSIFVSGKTVMEIQTDLAKKINSEIIASETCFVEVRLDNRYFSVIGESASGRYPIAKEQLNIYQALSQSHDILPYGNRAKVKIIRQTLTGVRVSTCDLRSADIVNSEFYYIQPNDIIYIQPLARRFWGINSFATVFAIISSAASLGLVVFNLTKSK